MSVDGSAWLPLLLCAMAFALGAVLFPAPKASGGALAPVIELAKVREQRLKKGTG